jgi:hypothetical protein
VKTPPAWLVENTRKQLATYVGPITEVVAQADERLLEFGPNIESLGRSLMEIGQQMQRMKAELNASND